VCVFSVKVTLFLFSLYSQKIAPETHRKEELPLDEKICLQVGSQCSANESEKPSPLVKKCISPPEGNRYKCSLLVVLEDTQLLSVLTGDEFISFSKFY
jgi:hypothetical protein